MICVNVWYFHHKGIRTWPTTAITSHTCASGINENEEDLNDFYIVTTWLKLCPRLFSLEILFPVENPDEKKIAHVWWHSVKDHAKSIVTLSRRVILVHSDKIQAETSKTHDLFQTISCFTLSVSAEVKVIWCKKHLNAQKVKYKWQESRELTLAKNEKKVL